MKKILFQGDSITDFGCDRSDVKGDWLGHGYATMVSGVLGYKYPNEFEFINRGISGNRIIDVLARVKNDIINLAPDYMSILIGVNDVWHEISKRNGVSNEKYELYYNILVQQIKEALPDIKIMILEPFVLKGSATEENWELFRKETERRAEGAKRVAEQNDLLFVPLMNVFDEATKLAPPQYWLYDGVHPAIAGHELIKNEWIKNFEKIK